jgi:hypothetical protein
MKEQRGYKVVVREALSEEWVSACAHVHVLYRPDKPAKPLRGYGPLCVFSDLAEARNFIGTLTPYRIFRCRYTPSRKLCVWYKPERGSDLRIRIDLPGLPDGTRLADSVTIEGEPLEVTP